MSWRKHETKSFRKLITVQEWADYTGLSKGAILNNLKKYKMAFQYDPQDIYSVLDFFRYLIKKQPRTKVS